MWWALVGVYTLTVRGVRQEERDEYHNNVDRALEGCRSGDDGRIMLYRVRLLVDSIENHYFPPVCTCNLLFIVTMTTGLPG